MYDYDVLVLGGGSAGTRAAATAAKKGARVAMINDGELGGLCILRGCMPTKAMLASAHALHEAKHLAPFGVHLRGEVVPDFKQIIERKNAQVQRFKNAKIRGIEKGGYEVIDARARFATGGGVEAGGRVLTARRYVIAVGSVPTILPISGIADVPVMTSDDVMRLSDTPPRSMVVQGAGPIGLELAQFFARIGTKVLLVNRSPLLSRFNAPLLGEELTRALEAEENFDLAVPGVIGGVRPVDGGIGFTIESGGRVFEHEAECFLMAAGRHAAVADLGLEHVGVSMANGGIQHDDAMQTTNPEVFVAGDATNEWQILHIANEEGEVAGLNAAAGEVVKRVDRRLSMGVIYTDPPFTQVGVSESEARRRGHDAVSAMARFPETGRAITMGAEYGAWSMVADRETREILGSAILGPRADDLVHAVSVLMYNRNKVDEIFEMPWYHPTLSEVILNLARDLVSAMDTP